MTKEEITSILGELDAELKKSAAEIASSLSKADGDKPPEDTSAPAADSAPADSAPDAPPAPDASAAPAPDMSAAPAPDASAAPGGDPAADAGPGVTPEALQAEYSQLSPEELDMHLQAALAAKEALSAAAGPAAGGMPPPGPGMPPAAAGPAGAPPVMGKEELKINSENTGGKISKSEALIDAIVAKLEKSIVAKLKNTEEDIQNLSKAMTTVLSTPQRRAVTHLSDVSGEMKKSETGPMTKAQVDEFIKDNASKMTKSERDIWLQYVDNKAPASKLAPMFERLSNLNK